MKVCSAVKATAPWPSAARSFLQKLLEGTVALMTMETMSVAVKQARQLRLVHGFA